MNSSRLKNLIRTQAFVLVAILAQACGQVQGTTSTCAAGVAQISVTDNVIRRDCGCAEAGNSTFTGTSLVCTVPVGTRLYIDYLNIQTMHHLIFSNTSYVLSPHDPASDGNANPIDAITLTATTAGMTFTDAANGNGGTIIVQ